MTSGIDTNLEHAIEAAQGLWVDADWQHELRRDGRIVLADDGETPVYCNGELDECETCIDARVDSETAECYARWAAQAARRGDLARVSAFLERARALEAAYGDAPTWGPVAKLAERLRAEQGGEQ